MRCKPIILTALAVLGLAGFSARGVPDPEMEEDSPETGEHEMTGVGPSGEFMVTTWRTSEGLPVNEINELEETSDGYLWMGSFLGLVRFDGMRFETFFSTPEGMRYGPQIGPLARDAHGWLWFAPDQVGVGLRDARGFSEALTNGAVLSARVTGLCSDGAQHMFWVDANGGLGKFFTEQPKQAERIPGEATASSRWARDTAGTMWLVNPRGLRIYQPDRWRDVPLPGSASLVATPRRAGGMWVAREGKLRFVTADGPAHEAATFPWIGQSRVTALFEDSRERLWIGTIGQGLYCYARGTFTQVVPTASRISCLLEDSQGNLWAGTRGGGLVRVRDRQFFMHDLSTGLKTEFVRSLAPDQSGRVWLATAERGLSWWQGGTAYELGEADGWKNFDSLSVLPRRDGSVWVSTSHRGLWRWKDGKVTRRVLGPDGPKEPVMDMLEDQQGRLWMVTDNTGIYCLTGEKYAHYGMAEGLPSTYLRRIIEDEAGDLWAGDWEGAIARWRNNRWEIVRKANGHGDAVRSMAMADGALWIGTSAGGLLRFKEGKTARVTMEQGLPDACIQQLLPDGKGALWGGTPHRLFRLSLDQLNAVMDGHRPAIDAITYGRSDGLPDVSFASWCDPRCARTGDGEMWFATANGAIHFRPGELPTNPPPQVLLSQTLWDGKPISEKALRQLRPGPGRLEFRYTAPCLTAPERVRFRYQLTGVDPDWVEAGTARTATYASIPPGDHIFRVMASSPEGTWNPQAASVVLAVHPFFWQTNWFLVLVAGVAAGSGVWVIRRATVRRLRLRLENLRQLQAVDRERARIAQDIHDELGANLTSIGLLADMGVRRKSDPEAVQRELDQISQTARESVAAMDAIVWALNPSNDSLDHFANYVAQFTHEFFRPTALRIRLDLPANLPPHPMSTEPRHELFLIVKESYNNIVRHAQATEVSVKLACEDGHLYLTIADNGRGLSKQNLGEGRDGLVNLRERIARLGGTLRLESEPGQGTKLQFRLALFRLRTN